jgi:hypothetical protein
VKVWDVEQKACLRELTEHEDTVETICSHPTSDGNITLYMHLIMDLIKCKFIY